jgi:flagellar basal-body rod modification protein FlgD
MTTVSPTTSSGISQSAQQTLDTLLAKIGAKPASTTSTPAAPKTTLDQSDFLKLMTAQMSNQDPFQPQSNTEMIAQMAQFSTVTGIQQLNTTVSNMETELAQNRIATAASFIGKSVLVPGNTALADSSGGISGAVDLPSAATGLTLQITRSTGELVKTIDLGANPAGLVGFSWDGKDANGNSIGDSTYNVTALMTGGGSQSNASTDVYGPITEAPVPSGTDPQTFKVGGVGTVNMTDIKSFKF